MIPCLSSVNANNIDLVTFVSPVSNHLPSSQVKCQCTKLWRLILDNGDSLQIMGIDVVPFFPEARDKQMGCECSLSPERVKGSTSYRPTNCFTLPTSIASET